MPGFVSTYLITCISILASGFRAHVFSRRADEWAAETSVLTEPRGVIQSPNFPDPFPTPIHLRWVIDASHLGESPNITVYLTQLFLKNGLKFTGYNSVEEYERRVSGSGSGSSVGGGGGGVEPGNSCYTHEATMYDILNSPNYTTHTKFLAIDLKLDRLEGNHLRVEDELLHVFGFNITYEVGATRKTTCDVVSCSFVGHCYAGDDYQDYQCSCFNRYFGKDCSNGPLCNSNENACKNGASCRLVGASDIYCNCSTAYHGQRCEYEVSNDFFHDNSECDEAPCLVNCESQNEQFACNYCENNVNCLLRCYYGQRNSTCVYPAHYILDLEAKEGDWHRDFTHETFEAFIFSSLQELNPSSEELSPDTSQVKVEYLNSTKAKVYLTLLRPNEEIMRSSKKLTDVLGHPFVGATITEEPLLMLQNISITSNQQIRNPGDDFNITCFAQGPKSISFMWYKDNTFVKGDGSYKVSETLSPSETSHVSVLSIHKTGNKTQGVYTCQISSPYLELKICKSVEVFVLLEPMEQPKVETHFVGLNGSVTLLCGSDFSTLYYWRKNYSPFEMNHNEFWEDVFPTGSVLKASNIMKPVNYTCQMAGPTGISSIEFKILVDSSRCASGDCICYKDKLLTCPSHDSFSCATLKDCDESARAELNCETKTVVGRTHFEAVISLTDSQTQRNITALAHDNFTSNFNKSIYNYFSASKTLLENLDTIPLNETHFKIQFSVDEFGLKLAVAAIKDCIRVKMCFNESLIPVKYSRADDFVLKTLTKVGDDDEFSLTCKVQANANSSINFQWYKDGLLIDTQSNRKIWSSVSSEKYEYIGILGVDSVCPLNLGWYTCRVSNGTTEFCRSIKVAIADTPQVIVNPLSQTVKKGENVTIYCSIKSNCLDQSTQNFVWMRNGLPVEDDSSKKTHQIILLEHQQSQLTLYAVHESSEYTCQLTCGGTLKSWNSSHVCVMNENDFKCQEDGWPDTGMNCSAYKECPSGYIGDYVSRTCTSLSFSPPDFSLCISSEFLNLIKPFNQLELGYQNGSINASVDSFHAFVKNKRFYLPGEPQAFLTLMDDLWDYVQSHIHEGNLTHITDLSFQIVDLLLKHLDSKAALQLLLSSESILHPWILLPEQQSIISRDESYTIDTSSLYYVSRRIKYPNCTQNISIITRNQAQLTSLRRLNLALSPCSSEKFDEIISGVIFKNASIFFPSNFSKSLKDESKIFNVIEPVVLSVAVSNRHISTSIRRINLTSEWEVVPRIEWNVTCVLITPGKDLWNSSACQTSSIGINLTGCFCSELGAITVLYTKTISANFSKESNLLSSMTEVCTIIVTVSTFFRVVYLWIKDRILLSFLKVAHCLTVLCYFLRAFSSSSSSLLVECSSVKALNQSSLQILVVSLLTSQLLVIYFKTYELPSILKYILLLSVNGFSIVTLFFVEHLLNLFFQYSTFAEKMFLLALSALFSFVFVSLFLCLCCKMRAQFPAKTNALRQEVNNCSILLILIVIIDIFQVGSSLSHPNGFIHPVFYFFCFLLSCALFILHFSLWSSEKFTLSFRSFHHLSIFTKSRKHDSNSNAEEFLPLTVRMRVRAFRTRRKISQDRRSYPER